MELLGLSMGYVYSLHPKCGLRTPHMSGGSLSKHWELHGWWKVLIFIECSGRKENQEDWADSSRVEGSQGNVRLHTGVSGHCSSGDINWGGAQETARQKGTAGSWGTEVEGRNWESWLTECLGASQSHLSGKPTHDHRLWTLSPRTVIKHVVHIGSYRRSKDFLGGNPQK